MTIDLSTMLAKWRAGSLKEKPTKALLGKLEKTDNARVEKIQESRTLTPEAKTLEIAEARRNSHSDFKRMRREILSGYDEGVEAQRRIANPPVSDGMLTRMGLISAVALPVWQRSPGDMIRQAERFGLEGDEAGLRLVRENAGLLKDSGPRRTLLEGVDEALDTFKPDTVRKAELEGRSLKLERDHFELASGLRESGIIAARAGRYRQWSPRGESHDDNDGIEPSEAEAS
jgi:hypothetical protein